MISEGPHLAEGQYYLCPHRFQNLSMGLTQRGGVRVVSKFGDGEQPYFSEELEVVRQSKVPRML